MKQFEAAHAREVVHTLVSSNPFTTYEWACTTGTRGDDAGRGVRTRREGSSSDVGGWDAGGAGGGQGGRGAMLRSVSRMFQERVQYFGDLQFTCDSILAGGRRPCTPLCVRTASKCGRDCVARASGKQWEDGRSNFGVGGS